jgi:hypothetical protein
MRKLHVVGMDPSPTSQHRVALHCTFATKMGLGKQSFLMDHLARKPLNKLASQH